MSTGTLERISLGIINVAAEDFERIKRLNIPDPDNNVPNILEEVPTIPARPGEHYTQAAMKTQDKPKVSLSSSDNDRTLTSGSVIGDGSKLTTETVIFAPVYVRVNGSWKLNRPTLSGSGK